ncbi:hypothetical protein [Lentibacillus sp.]|uniref:hypothetical protein n=1 Tax=Lentibacillus sp. TaxID=1925746 RepID=UPI002B4B7F41|nr:hypothetical protein [Lentibacillus sp.]HLS10507.1 hypothetical protein [Lentibacillus sp.]
MEIRKLSSVEDASMDLLLLAEPSKNQIESYIMANNYSHHQLKFALKSKTSSHLLEKVEAALVL